MTYDLAETSTAEGRPYFLYLFAEGDQVNISYYTDIAPATVVEVTRRGKCVKVQKDRARLGEGQKPDIVPGGFAGHCTNQRDLGYDIERDEDGSFETYTLRKWRGRYCWTQKGGSPDGRQHLGQGWDAFYDYNF